MEDFMHEKTMNMRNTLLERAANINNVKVIKHIGEDSPELYKNMVPLLKGKFADTKFAFIIGTVYEGKPSLILFLSQPMIDAGFNASTIVREAAKEIQGGGGGQAFMATAGGKNADGIQIAIDKIVEAVTK
jgi:alanyl-tRNA synthetase